jgi:hypothetical protein
MDLHFKARRLLYRYRAIGALYAWPPLRQLVRRWFFRVSDWVPVAYVELTSVCNAACIFCTYPTIAASGKTLQKMPPTIFSRVLERLAEERVTYVNMTPATGEVFGNPAWAERIEEIAALPAVERIHFYTNAILLRGPQLERLLALKGFEKLNLSISTGGIDRASYHALFGVDQFDRVRDNVRALMARLGERGARIPVSVEVRLMRDQTEVGIAEAARVYGTDAYRHSGINLRRIFDPLGGIANDPRLDYYKPIDKGRRPCQLLGDTRFAADGGVWVCGCVVSEQPGDTSLRIGRFDDPSDAIAARRDALISAWRDRGEVPKTCQGCAGIYLQGRGWPQDTPPMFTPRSPGEAPAAERREEPAG